MVKKILEFPSGKCDSKPKKKAVSVNVVRYDEQGEIISQSYYTERKQNGSGFVISYTSKMVEFIEKNSIGSVVRTFLYLAHNQQYGVNGIFGYRCSHKHLEQALNLDRKSVYTALTKLKEDFLVNETRIDGISEFMVNPNYVTMGREKQARIREWNLRWEREFKRKSTKV